MVIFSKREIFVYFFLVYTSMIGIFAIGFNDNQFF